MSLSTFRINFYRIASLIIDHGAESMRCLLDQFIQKKYRISFRDFVSRHQHEMYHHFNNGICCMCSNNRWHHKTVISAWQMEKLFDKNSPKLSGHKYSSKCDYCCSTVRSTLQLQDIDITLLRFFLVTYFEEEFWQSCFTSGIVFHDFLNTHKHDIFHLLQLNTSCCLCQANPGYTPMACMVLTEKDRLNITQWETMFHTSELPCTQHRSYFPNGYTLNPCSVSATKGIRHLDLDGRARMIILSKFCTMMRHIDVLVNTRNTVFAHAIKGELSNEEFRQLWIEIENSIIYVSNVTSTDDSRKLCILELKEKSLDELMCLELQCLILKQIHGDELVLEACHKLQDTVEVVKESIDLKLQQIALQITAFTSNMSDVVRNELSIKLNEYSDTTRNIIDNTRREIECHDEDKTYVKTSAVAAATELLDSNNLLILFGRAGSGKTSTALEIASLFHANGYIIMKLEQNLSKDFKTYFISNNKQLIIFEDLFGKADIRYNEDIHSNLLEVLKPHLFNGVSKFIITVRSYKSEVDGEIATYHQLLSEAAVVNLNGSLSYLEKERILTMHAKHNKLEICLSNMQNIIATDSYLGFPEASRLFCSFEKFFSMGHVFFTSPTKVLQTEISDLKRFGYHNIDSALQYCVLIFLMMDSSCKDSFGKNIRRVSHERNQHSSNFKNINCSVIEYLYHSIFNKEIMITIDMLQEMCKQLSNKYVKKDLNSNAYVFQHQTVFEAVLSSYWHLKTMEDVIKYFEVDILAEYVRPFDSIVTGYKKYLIVPMKKCTDLAHKIFETFLANCNEIYKYFSLIQQSDIILKLLNSKLDEWYTKEDNVLKSEWIIIQNFIRPSTNKKENNVVCANADDKHLIKRLVKEFENEPCNVISYIQTYGSEDFSKNFNAKAKEWFQSEENVVNCKWDVIKHLIRPTTFTFEIGKIGTVTNDGWLIKKLINILVKPESSIPPAEDRSWSVEQYIKKYGCDKFVNMFNEKLAEWFQSKKNVIVCEWHVLNYFVRPTTFKIEEGQTGTVTNDGWLIERFINILVKPVSAIPPADSRTWRLEKYFKKYGCEKFVNMFNEKLAEWFQSKENIVNCEWHVLDYCVRPTTFKIEEGQIGTVTNDGWLIERFINILVKPVTAKPPAEDRTWRLEKYFKKYGCEKFVNMFNEKLAEWFQSKENIVDCEWHVLDYCVRPTTFKIEEGQIGTVTNDGWLIERFINILVKPVSAKPPAEDRTWMLEKYFKKYGCEKIVNMFNEKFAEWFQSKENIADCEWHVLDYCVRPTTFKIEEGQIGTVTNDGWLIERFINILVKPVTAKPPAEDRTWMLEKYLKKYGCEKFVNMFNEKLAQWFQSKGNIVNCEWHVLDYCVRPTTFKIEESQIGTVTNDGWLIETFINILVKPVSAKPPAEDRTCRLEKYFKKYGCEKFVNMFNEKLAEWFQSKKNIVYCEWHVLDYCVRPTTFKIEEGQIGTVTNDGWLIERFINILVKPVSAKPPADSRTWRLEKYLKNYGCEKFVNMFNEKLAQWFQSKGNIVNCEWHVLDYCVRPTTFKIEEGQIGTVTNDGWLIEKFINILVKPVSAKPPAEDRTWRLEKYFKKYGCEKFVNMFNEKLAEWFQSKENIVDCEWHVLDYCVRPTTFKIEEGQIGTVTNDGWLIERFINILVKPVTAKPPAEDRTWRLEKYFKKYGCEKFVNMFNEKLAEWFQSKENIVDCEWHVLDYCVRPTTFKIEEGQIGTVTNDSWLIERFINILVKPVTAKPPADSRTWMLEKYLKKYGCEKFVNMFNEKLAQWFQSKGNIVNCEWHVLDYCVRPTTFKIEEGQIGTVTNDGWLIEKFINILVKPVSAKPPAEVRTWRLEKYFKKYGCEKFVNMFNEKLAEWFQSKKNIVYCEWHVLDYCVRPTTFKIEEGQIGTVTNDGWLIERFINILVKPVSAKPPADSRTWRLEKYLKKYGCEKFVNMFNEKLAQWFQSKGNIVNCEWHVLDYCVRPTTFKIEESQIGTVTNDGWLIEKFINILVKPVSAKPPAEDRTWRLEKYFKKYGCEKFVNMFNEKLAEWFQSKKNIVYCEWHVLDYCVRPTTFKIEEGQIGTVTNDGWLIERFINILVKPVSAKPPADSRTWMLEKYLKKYGCEKFVNMFNEKLAQWFQSKGNIVNCEWHVLDYCVRPTTFKIEEGQIGTVTNDGWLIEKFINILVKPVSAKPPAENRTWRLEKYFKKYGCEKFVNMFNEKLAEWFQSKENIVDCEWHVLDYCVRPTTFKIEEGQIGTVTNDGWLIERFINILLKPVTAKPPAEDRTWRLEKYFKKYGCEKFVNMFNEKLAEWFQSKTNIVYCEWHVLDYCVRPTTFKIEEGQIGTVTNDGWLIERFINILVKPVSAKPPADSRTWRLEKYLKKYGCEKFVNMFNEKLAQWFQSKGNIVNCEWHVLDYCVRPTTFKIEEGQIGTVTNDGWLIEKFINILVKPVSAKPPAEDRTWRLEKYFKKYGCEKFVNMFNEKLAEWFQSKENIVYCEWHVLDYCVRPTTFKIEEGQIGTVTNDGWLIEKFINILMKPVSAKPPADFRTWRLEKYFKKYGCEKFVNMFKHKLAEWFQTENNVRDCEWHVIYYCVRPTTFTIEDGQIGAVTNDVWLIQRLINKLMKPSSCERTDYRTFKINKYFEKYGCDKFIKLFNEMLAKWLQTEENVLSCEWDSIEYCIRPSTFTIENGKLGAVTNDGWLIQRLINILVKPSSSKRTTKRTWEVQKYIAKFGCEKFVDNFREKLKEWVLQNMQNCNLLLFTTFVRPQSWLNIEKIRIYIHDEHVILYLFSKLEQKTNVYTVKSFIKKYGSYEFKTNFNKLLKEKLARHQVLDPECTWECLERFFDNVPSSDATGRDVCDLDSSNSIDTNSNSADSESDSSIDVESSNSSKDSESDTNIDDVDAINSSEDSKSDSNIDDVDASNSSEDSESDSNIDVDSSEHSEDSDNETNHHPSSNNDDNNGVLVMIE